MADNTQPSLLEFCNSIINGNGGLLDYEQHEVAVPTVPRDVAVAAWTIRCLANPGCEGSEHLVEMILAKRELVKL